MFLALAINFLMQTVNVFSSLLLQLKHLKTLSLIISYYILENQYFRKRRQWLFILLVLQIAINYHSNAHLMDIATLDFMKAFDMVPYH